MGLKCSICIAVQFTMKLWKARKIRQLLGAFATEVNEEHLFSCAAMPYVFNIMVLI
jgi:hypothetical protein